MQKPGAYPDVEPVQPPHGVIDRLQRSKLGLDTVERQPSLGSGFPTLGSVFSYLWIGHEAQSRFKVPNKQELPRI